MKMLNTIDCEQIAGGQKYIQLNNGNKISADNISNYCHALFQEILPSFADKTEQYAAASVAMVEQVINAGCVGDFSKIRDNI